MSQSPIPPPWFDVELLIMFLGGAPPYKGDGDVNDTIADKLKHVKLDKLNHKSRQATTQKQTVQKQKQTSWNTKGDKLKHKSRQVKRNKSRQAKIQKQTN